MSVVSAERTVCVEESGNSPRTIVYSMYINIRKSEGRDTVLEQ